METAHDASLWRYMTLVRSVPELEKTTELELARRFKETGDLEARETLVRAHLRYVVAIALKYRRYRASLADLIAEGNHGLLHALEKFDPDRGNRFVTYAAYWIRAYMLGAAIKSWNMVGGGGVMRSKLFFKFRRERVRIRNLHGEGESADALLAERLGVTPEVLERMLTRLDANDLALDAPANGDSGARLIDVLPALDPSQEEVAIGSESEFHARQAVGLALEGLDERERYIVEHRLMADPSDAIALAEVGRRFGVSRERARQLEARVKRKLRTKILAHGQANGVDFSELGSAA
ncbi:MAG TPA: sigma-70 family RNA polymerase sigma factor [Polyangiaceae bacterium]